MHAHSQTQILPFSVKTGFIARVLSPLVRCRLPHSTAQLTRLLPSPLRPSYSLPQPYPQKYLLYPTDSWNPGQFTNNLTLHIWGQSARNNLGEKVILVENPTCLCQTVTWLITSFIPQAVFFRGLQRRSGTDPYQTLSGSQMQKGPNASSSKFQVPLASKTRGFLGPELPAHSGSRNKSHLCFEWFQPQQFTPGRGREGGKKS